MGSHENAVFVPAQSQKTATRDRPSRLSIAVIRVLTGNKNCSPMLHSDL